MDIYTDGAYSSKKDMGGWAFYCPELHLRVCGREKSTTNNRMELTGAIRALEFVDDSNLIDYKNITIWSDSMYLVATMNGTFARKSNLDLWNKLDDLINGLFDKNISFKHIKGHTGEKNGNNTADILANLISQI